MNKDDLIALLELLEIPYNEGIQNDNNTFVYPRIVFWEYEWDPIIASGEKYNTTVVYQISFFSETPRHEKLLDLISKLSDRKIYPHVYHEYIQDKKYFHSYFALEVLENV